MKKNFNQNLKKIDGTDHQEPEGKDGELKPILLKKFVLDALLMTYQGEDLTGQQKVTRYNIALKIEKAKDGETELTPEEASEIKAVVAKAYGPLVVGQVHEFLNA